MECRWQWSEVQTQSVTFAPMLCFWVHFTWQMIKTRVIRLCGVEGRDMHDQIAFCAFHSFLVEVQMNAGYIHATHVKFIVITWRLWLQVTRGACNNFMLLEQEKFKRVPDFLSTALWGMIIWHDVWSLTGRFGTGWSIIHMQRTTFK